MCSALISMGETRVICTASVQEGVPRWLAGSKRGWVTVEYGMLRRSTGEPEAARRQQGPSGRPDSRDPAADRPSLRAVIDLDEAGRAQDLVDCDVLQADGGTRRASITGGMVALQLATDALGRARA